MNILNRLFGKRPSQSNVPRTDGQPLSDEQAVERYRYLLRTAPPEAIEEAHAEAFAQLTPEQRRLVLEGLNNDAPVGERTDRDDPKSLARMATRAELQRPGTMERNFRGNTGGMPGMGGFMAGSLFSTIAGVVIGTAIADAIFNDGGNDQGSSDSSEADQGSDSGDSGSDTGGFDSGDTGDFGGGDFGGSDFGGDFGGDF
ncbi:hypothetical protein BH09CHL1_BH09CHL1_31830 [soil metagenome]